MPIPEPTHLVGVEKSCPRCGSSDTKWRYYNNRSKVGETQPRYHCNKCKRQFTYAGNFRPTTKPQRPPARKVAEATAKEVAEQEAALAEATAREVAVQSELDAAALEVARRIQRKAEKATKLAKAARRAAKAAKKAEKVARRDAKRASKREARKTMRLAPEEPLDGSWSDMGRHPASPAASSEAEMMASGEMKSSEGVPGGLVCGFVAPVVDGVDVMEHVGVVCDEALGLSSAGLESWVAELAEDDPALSSSEMWETLVDGAENDSGLRSVDDLWAEHGGDIDSGLELLAASCGDDGSAVVDTGLALSKNCGAGDWVDSGLAGSEVGWEALVSGSAGSDEELELIVSMLSQYDDIDSGLEWMSDPCRDGSQPDDCGLGGFEMWMDCGPAESGADLDWSDLVIMGIQMEGLTL